MNDEMFRQSLIEFMNVGLLNEFVNIVFKYKLKDDESIYMQFKIVNGNIVLNIFDNSKKNRFRGYVFTNKNIDNEKDSNIIYVNIEDSYKRYKEKKTRNKLYLLGALLKSNNIDEKRDIIELFGNESIKKVLLKYFL